MFGVMLTVIVSTSTIGEMFWHRAALVQPYDLREGGRFDSLWSALQNAATNPTGVGPGRTIPEFFQTPHNLYVHVLAEGGWLAGIGFLGFVFSYS